MKLKKFSMLEQAIESVKKCLKTQNPYLSLSGYDLTDNDVAKGTELDYLLEKCIHLKTLILSSNKFKVIKKFENLGGLYTLNLGINEITEISGLENLSSLTTLYLNHNKITEIKGLENLTELNNLSLLYNKIKKIEGLQNLRHIYLLDLGYNEIVEIIGLDNLSKLYSLNLEGNNISKIEGLQSLHALSVFYFSYECLSGIKSYLSFWEKKRFKDLKLPREILIKGNDVVTRYLKSIAREGQENVYEAKLVLAGSGESGKTSLSWRLNNKSCSLPNQDERTKEVEVSDYTFITKERQKFTAHIWDFGGQQIIHHFHRLFMNENTLYLLLTETSRANDDFDYWLQTIQLFGGNSPILFVQNKRNGVPRSLNIQPYKSHFNIVDNLYEINLLTNEGLDTVEKAIQYHILQLPIVQRVIPKSWFFIKEDLAHKKKSFISYATFIKICKEYNISSRIDIEDVGDFLHNIGTVLWYRQNPILQDKIILDKHWITKALFKLIFDEKINGKQRGYFTLADAQLIWDKDEYSYYSKQLIALMLEFKLAYDQRGKTTSYIIPALLTSTPPNKYFDTPNRIIIEYRYIFLPRGIVNSLTAQMHDKIENDSNAWSEGVWLKDGSTEAKISENRLEKFIRIEIAGIEHREMFGAIKANMDNIHREYKGIKYQLKIPCICSMCKKSKDKHLFNYENIIDRIGGGKKLTIECVKSGEDVVLQELLDYLLPKQNLDPLEELKHSIEINFTKLHKGIDIIKDTQDDQNKIILKLVTLSSNSENELALILEKIDNDFDDQKANDFLEKISKEIIINVDQFPKRMAEEWKKINLNTTDVADVKAKLKLKVPIIPLLMDYENELNIDLKKMSKNLRKYIF